jgi:hypothetical protein
VPKLLLAAMWVFQVAQPSLSSPLWSDVTRESIGQTAQWTNKVEIADINGERAA